MNRNVKYRSIAYGTWHIGDARKFVEERFNCNNNKKCENKQSSTFSPKNEAILEKVDKNLLTLQISSDGGVLFKDELRSVTPIIEITSNIKCIPSFDYYNQEDNLLTVSTTETNSLKFDSLNKKKKLSINNQHSMADSGIADNSDSSAEGDWYSSNEYLQYCQKIQQTANTEDDFSFSTTINNTKKDDNNHIHCSLETIYQNSVSPNSTNNIPTMTRRLKSQPTTNNILLKSLNDNSKFNINNVQSSKMRIPVTGSYKMIPLNDNHTFYHQQPNNLNYHETNLIYNLPKNTTLYNNYHKPYCQTNYHKLANIHPQHNKNQNPVNCIPFSMVNDSLYTSHDNSSILDNHTEYHNTKNLLPYDDKFNYKCNSIDKRRAKSVEIGNTNSIILNDQGYNTMRIKNFTNPSNTLILPSNKHESLKNWKNNSLIIDNCDIKKDKTFSAIKSTKNFFQRFFTNPSSTLPRKWKKSNDKNNLRNEEMIFNDMCHVNSLTKMHKYGTIHRTKTDINCLLNNFDLLREYSQQNGNIDNYDHTLTLNNIYKNLKDLSIPQSLSQKSSSDSCYTSTVSSNSPTIITNDKILDGKFKVDEGSLIKGEKYNDKVYPSIENFKNWNEIYDYLKNELKTIKEKDYRIIENLRYTEEQIIEYKNSLI